MASFSEVAEQGKINYFEDNSLARKRIEVKCANCDAHLGHVFDDGHYLLEKDIVLTQFV